MGVSAAVWMAHPTRREAVKSESMVLLLLAPRLGGWFCGPRVLFGVQEDDMRCDIL